MTKDGAYFEFKLYDKVSSSVIKIHENLKGVTGAAIKAAAYFEELGSSAVRFNALSDTFSRMADAMTGAIQPGVDFQQQIADLSAITGITGTDLEMLAKASREVGVSSGLGASQAAEAFKLLASNIDVSVIGGVEGLKSLQKETITLAQASGVDLPTAADTMAASLNQFRLPATEAARVINVLAAGAKYGAAEVPHLAESLKYVGPVAGTAGVSIESAVGALEVLSQSAIKGSQAGTDLSAILVKMQSVLGIDIGKVGLPAALEALKPKLNDVSFLTKTFGLENLKSIQTLIANSDMVGTMTDRVTGSNIAYEQAAIRTDTYAERMKRLSAWFDNLKISVFEVTGSFVPFLQIGANALTQFSLMIPALKAMKDGFSWLLQAKNRQIIADKAILLWQKMQVAWNYILAASIRVVNMVMNMNPIIAIVTAVAIGIGLIIAYWDKLKAFFVKLVSFWAKYLNPFGWIYNLINYLFPKAGKAIRDFFGKIGDWIFGWIDKMVGWVKKAVGWIGKALGFGSGKKELKITKEQNTDFNTGGDDSVPGYKGNPGKNIIGDTQNGITSGGSKQTNVNIQIGKMVETIYVNREKGQTWEDVESKVKEVLLRVINSANRTQAAL